jgi:hypothetical protein
MVRLGVGFATQEHPTESMKFSETKLSRALTEKTKNNKKDKYLRNGAQSFVSDHLNMKLLHYYVQDTLLACQHMKTLQFQTYSSTDILQAAFYF